MTFAAITPSVSSTSPQGPTRLAGSGAATSPLADGSRNTERACVGEGYLNLCRAPCGSENDHVRNGLLRSDDGHALLAGELSGLAEILLGVRVAPSPKKLRSAPR